MTTLITAAKETNIPSDSGSFPGSETYSGLNRYWFVLENGTRTDFDLGFWVEFLAVSGSTGFLPSQRKKKRNKFSL